VSDSSRHPAISVEREAIDGDGDGSNLADGDDGEGQGDRSVR
jgi:hypothetical protein